MGGKTYENTPETPANIPPPPAAPEEKVDVKLEVHVAVLLQKLGQQYAEMRDLLTEETLDMLASKLGDCMKLISPKKEN